MELNKILNQDNYSLAFVNKEIVLGNNERLSLFKNNPGMGKAIYSNLRKSFDFNKGLKEFSTKSEIFSSL